jgi:predicted O-methyltransferase YrrM
MDLGQDQEYRDLMLVLVKLLQPKVYVEVGTLNGYTFNAIAELVEKAIAIDIKISDRISNRANVEKFQMETSEFVKKLGRTFSIDLLFIDADHSKEAVLGDVDSLLPFVREGTGLVLLHDTHPVNEQFTSSSCCGDAWKAAWEIRTSKKYSGLEIVTLPGPRAGLSIIRKSETQLSWQVGNEG